MRNVVNGDDNDYKAKIYLPQNDENLWIYKSYPWLLKYLLPEFVSHCQVVNYYFLVKFESCNSTNQQSTS